MKTAIYIRVSTDRQAEEGYSIDAQKEQLTALCISKQWKNYEYYIDGGWSGSNIARPEMERLIEEVKDKKIERVVVYKLDRLSRSQKDVLYLIEDVFIPHNVDFVSHTESLDTSTPMGRAMIGILAAFAQLERENIRMRTRMGMKERVKEGYWMGGGRVPFGYNYDSTQGILVPNEDAELVREMYDLYLQGYGGQTIANMLGLKYDRLVMQVLTRKTNYGVIEYNGVEYEGKHEPLISKDIYDKTMLEIARRSVSKVTSSKHLFAGLLICGKCGAKIRYQKYGTKQKLICYSQQKSKPYLVKDENCDLPKHIASEVEGLILQKLFLFKELEDDDQEQKESQTRSSLEILKEQKKDIERQIKKLFNLYATMDDDLLLDTINENKKKLAKIDERIELETNEFIQNNKKDIYNKNIKNLGERWQYLSFHQQQSVVRLLVDKILVYDDTVKVTLNI